MDILRACAITPCSASISLGTARERCCGLAMCTVPMAGGRCWSLSWLARRELRCASTVGPMRPLPVRRAYDYLEEHAF
jgi:hypothetical protein